MLIYRGSEEQHLQMCDKHNASLSLSLSLSLFFLTHFLHNRCAGLRSPGDRDG